MRGKTEMIRSKNSDTSGAARTQRVRWMNAAAGPKPVVRSNIGSMALDGILWNQGVWPQDQGTGSRPKATIPSPLGDLIVESGDGSATISFTPGSDGGSPILNYQYSVDGGVTFIEFAPAVTASPVTVTGLDNNTEYTIILKAVNAVGASVPSASVTVTPRGRPDAPIVVSYQRGDGTVEIAFTQGSDGGSPITNYSYSMNGFTYTDFSPAVTTSPITISGLNNANSYTINLKAVNMYRTSEPSGNLTIDPVSAPQSPTILGATAGRSSASVAFNPPTNNGGSTILSYTVISNPGGITASGAGSPITVTGLTNGTEYTFTVVATNAIGDSVSSSPSDPVTPSVQLTRMVLTSGIGMWTVPNGVTSIEYLLVGGGGGGGGGSGTGAGGGGGGGSAKTGTMSVTPGTTYNYTIGAGGAGGAGSSTNEVNGAAGENTVFSTVISEGGGLGYRSREKNGSNEYGAGGDAQSGDTPTTGGSGGNVRDGGSGNPDQGAGGGGGGAGGAGATSTSNGTDNNRGGAGGSGISSTLQNGTAKTYGAGGKGADEGTSSFIGTLPGAIGAANTGNGGGGGASHNGGGNGAPGGAGGSGIVVLAYYV